MKNALTIFLLFIFVSLHAQEENQSRGILIKTLPIQDAIYQNPNLIIEKPINEKYSVSLLVAFRFSDWIFKSTSFGGMVLPIKHNAKGYTLGGFFKHYYSKKKQIPGGFYVGGTLRYSDIIMPDVDYISDSDPTYFRTVELKRKTMEVGGIWGYQVLWSRFIMDFYVGTGLQYRISEEKLVSGNPKYLQSEYSTFIPRLYLGFSMGVKLF